VLSQVEVAITPNKSARRNGVIHITITEINPAKRTLDTVAFISVWTIAQASQAVSKTGMTISEISILLLVRRPQLYSRGIRDAVGQGLRPIGHGCQLGDNRGKGRLALR
jgi:hypothetical protein